MLRQFDGTVGAKSWNVIDTSVANGGDPTLDKTEAEKFSKRGERRKGEVTEDDMISSRATIQTLGALPEREHSG